MFNHMRIYKKTASAVSAILATVLLIYLTPLKNLNLVEPRMNNVDPKAFYNAYTKNPDAYVFIDVRPSSEFNKIHAPGSINLPLHTLYDGKYVLPKHGKTLVLTCSGNRASSVGYGYLEHYGFLNLERIEGGIENWQTEGLPVETQATP